MLLSFHPSHSVLFLLFFFPSPAPPRDLHSFPTRRSSDLPSSSMPSGPMDQMVTPSATTGSRRKRIDAPAPNGSIDRKSTRLNSSHRCISYAVFCLKKKKKIE